MDTRTKELMVYIIGPEMYSTQAAEHIERQDRICHEHGLMPVHAVHQLWSDNPCMEEAGKQYWQDRDLLKQADIIIANCNEFRGLYMHDRTAYVLGFADASHKPAYGYMNDPMPLAVRTQMKCHCQRFERPNQPPELLDEDDYLVPEDYGAWIDPIVQCSLIAHGANVVKGDFERCVAVIRRDLDTGTLRIGAHGLMHMYA